MLSPKTQTNLANAKGYFEEHLCADDYYAENGRVQGVWMGAGATLLGLERVVTRETFFSLCDNLHPSSGKRLTQRQKTTRNDKVGGEAANRRVCFDFTISPPKSVSIARLLPMTRGSWQPIARPRLLRLVNWKGSRRHAFACSH